MGVFFTENEEKFINIIDKLNNALSLASQALEYGSTSGNDHHLRVYYQNVLEQIAKSYESDLNIKLYATKYGISESEAPRHMLNKLNNQ